eukprot:scaffold280849_cov22-Tisochrysis_lutea.AAC.4
MDVVVWLQERGWVKENEQRTGTLNAGRATRTPLWPWRQSAAGTHVWVGAAAWLQERKWGQREW